MINPKIINPNTIKSYADLASPKLKGKVCLRDRSNVYNQSLVADQIVLRGQKSTAAWIKGMIANLADEVYRGDIALTRAIAEGYCGVGLVNSYYVARMLAGDNGKNDQSLAKNVKVKYPSPSHVNISGAGVVKYAKNKSEAIKLMEFLTSPTGAEGYARGSHEYPLKGYGNNPILKQFGGFRFDGVSANALGSQIQAAIRLMAANGWD